MITKELRGHLRETSKLLRTVILFMGAAVIFLWIVDESMRGLILNLWPFFVCMTIAMVIARVLSVDFSDSTPKDMND